MFRKSAVRRTNSCGVRITRRKWCLEKLFDLQNVLVSVTTMGLMKLKLRGTLKELHTTQKEKTPVGIDLAFNVLFMIVVGRFSKRTETSFDDGARSTSTQIWSKYNRIWTIPRVLPSSTDVAIVLLHQPTKLNSKSSTASIPHTTLKIPKRD